VSSFLLDDLYGSELSENAQLLRNIMYAADFLQNHIRHFYLFSLPDFVRMPDRPPFLGQSRVDLRLGEADNRRLVEQDYFQIGVTPRRLISFGLFRFGPQNERLLWPRGVLVGDRLRPVDVGLIGEDITNAWFIRVGEGVKEANCEVVPEPDKPGAYTWTKAARYAGAALECGPLARQLIGGRYRGGTSTMDRICARSLETLLLTGLVHQWLLRLEPGPPPISRPPRPVKSAAVSTTDAMRGALLHAARLEGDRVLDYDIVTPTEWNFSPKDRYGRRGPAETALTGAEVPEPDALGVVAGRIIRSFDPCISCATHTVDIRDGARATRVL